MNSIVTHIAIIQKFPNKTWSISKGCLELAQLELVNEDEPFVVPF